MDPAFPRLILGFLLCLGVALSQLAPCLIGSVRDASTGQPLAGAWVKVSNAYFSATSSDGSFEICGPDSGTWEIRISAIGYSSINVTCTSGVLGLPYFLDTLSAEIGPIVITDAPDNPFGITRLKEVEGTAIYANKKNEVIVMEDVVANTVSNTSRQIYAKVPGLNIWESDLAGVQLGIGGRGLNPTRVSNFNTRQNGYDISADALGYPESYYTPPPDMVERIEIVRGAASLQYGTQFGGMVNWRLLGPSPDSGYHGYASLGAGSFGLRQYTGRLGWTGKQIAVMGFGQYRTGTGWRPNSAFDQYSAFGTMVWTPNAHWRFALEYTFQQYLAQQPGGLTDRQFEQDPMLSFRERNWFRVNWNLFALQIDHRHGDRTRFNARLFGLSAGRDAIGNIGNISRSDGNAPRDLYQDDYLNLGGEFRVLTNYNLHTSVPSTFLAGIRTYIGHTDRIQGLGDSLSGPRFRLLDRPSALYSSYKFPGLNLAAFSENVFRIGTRVTITPGIRYEFIRTIADGYYYERNYDGANNLILELRNEEYRSRTRSILLAGIGAGYRFTPDIDLYANISQNYRAINFNDMRVVNPNLRVDPELKDERGFSADLGVRGNAGNALNFDVGGFFLKYRGRIGQVYKVDPLTYVVYSYRTNVADSWCAGIEAFGEYELLHLFRPEGGLRLSVWVNGSWMHSAYMNSQQPGIEGNEVEMVPSMMVRSGLTTSWKKMRGTVQWSYTAAQFTDATNALQAPGSVIGIVPEYQVADLSVSWSPGRFRINTGINNLLNTVYFTRRAEGFPGPGILPADPRNIYFSVAIHW